MGGGRAATRYAENHDSNLRVSWLEAHTYGHRRDKLRSEMKWSNRLMCTKGQLADDEGRSGSIDPVPL